MFFVAPSGGKNVVRKPIVKQLETFLIRLAYDANPDLENKNKYLQDWSIKGLVRADRGHPPIESQVFAKMMNLKLRTSNQ